MSPLNFKKTVGFIHLWLGLISGLVVFILSITGALYTFQDEIKDIVYKEHFFVDVPPGAEKLPLSTLIPIAENAIGKEYKITRAELSQDPSRSWWFRAVKYDSKGLGYNNYIKYYYKAFINPYTGKVLYVENAKKEFFTIVLALHMNLLLGDEIGHIVVLWSVVIFAIMLITGAILWWPLKKNQIKAAFTVKWKAKFKRLNYDLHNVSGAYAFIVLMVITYTGLMWSFEFAADKNLPMTSDTSKTDLKLPADKILQHAKAASPGTAYFLYNFPVTKTGTVNVSAYLTEDKIYKRIQNKYDQYTGELLLQGKPFEDFSLKDKIIALNYDLHIGTVWGFTGKILAFLACIVAASLPVTGFLIWWKRGLKSGDPSG